MIWRLLVFKGVAVGFQGGCCWQGFAVCWTMVGWVWCDCRGDLELLGCFIGMVGGMCLVLVVLVGGVVLIALVAGGL